MSLKLNKNNSLYFKTEQKYIFMDCSLDHISVAWKIVLYKIFNYRHQHCNH